MKLKDFMEMAFKENIFQAMNSARDLIELESIEQRLNLIWGVELDINVVPAQKKEGRFYGKGVIEAVAKDFPKK